MKKIIFILLLVALLFSSHAYASETALLDLRNKIFDESSQIKALMTTSKMPVLVNGLWDTSVIATLQLDAYFYMVGIFNSIPKGKAPAASLDFIINWLNLIKNTNLSNIKNIAALSGNAEAAIQSRVKILTSYFMDLSIKVNNEIDRVNLIKKTLK